MTNTLATPSAPTLKFAACPIIFRPTQGVNQTLELLVLAGPVDPPTGINWDWLPGTSLNAALFTALRQAFPTYQVNINIVRRLAALQH